jgi:hypothetical protein
MTDNQGQSRQKMGGNHMDWKTLLAYISGMDRHYALGQMKQDTFGKPYLPTLLAMKWD